MSELRIVPCRMSHLRMVARNLREEERAECAIVGIEPRHVMHALWKQSAYSRTGLLEDEPIVVWGDSAPTLSLEGFGWLFSTPGVERVKVAFIRGAMRELAERLQVRTVIRTSALASSRRCVRFWCLLGFEADEPDERGLRELSISRGA